MSERKAYILEKLNLKTGQDIQHLFLLYENGNLFVYGSLGPRDPNLRDNHSLFRPIPRRWLDLSNIHPEVTGSMTRYDRANVDVYMKRPRYLHCLAFCSFEDLFGTERVAKITLREIRSAEILARNPHKNIVKYLGVDTDSVVHRDGFGVLGTLSYQAVTGLAFERYDIDLHDMVVAEQPIDINKIVKDVADGLDHMHSLGLVHSDIKPENIFYKDGNFAIGDFDSVHVVNTPYYYKTGTPGWAKSTWEVAEYEHDWHCLEKVERWLYLHAIHCQDSE